MTEKLCGSCGKPLVRKEGETANAFDIRQTCGGVCRANLTSDKIRARFEANQIYAPWPTLSAEPDFANGFASQNLRFKPDGRRLDRPAADVTAGGVGSAWMA